MTSSLKTHVSGWNLKDLPRWGGLQIEGEEVSQTDALIVGISYDRSSAYRPGAALAPDTLRLLSSVMSSVSERGQKIDLWLDDAGNLDYFDSNVKDWWNQCRQKLVRLARARPLFVLGGDHSGMIPVIAAQVERHPDLRLLWIDAHPDLRDSSRGNKWTSGCALRRALESSELTPNKAMIIGARDFDYAEVEFANAQGLEIISCADLVADPSRAISKAQKFVDGHPFHLSLDIDVLDPSVAPGTERPSSGGLSMRQLLNLVMPILKVNSWVGLDIAEICPEHDVQEITSLAALKILFEVFAITPTATHGPRPEKDML